MEVVALDSFARIILEVFAQMFDVDISIVTDRSAKAASSSAIGVSFGATGSGLSMSTISGFLHNDHPGGFCQGVRY